MPIELIYAPIQIDHIYPTALGGTEELSNLCLSCPFCNLFKRTQTQTIDPETGETFSFFNPRLQTWNEHFQYSVDEAIIEGKTGCGRATIAGLQMNRLQALSFRRLMISLGKYPPTETVD
jgi:hypothetical protein